MTEIRLDPPDTHCPDESHDTALAIFSRGETDFLECQSCGLLFRRKFPSHAELEKVYEAAYSADNIGRGGTDQESGTYATEAYARFLLARHIRPGMRVLDFGAGTGELVALLRKAGIDTAGFEYSSAAREYCRQHRATELFDDLASLPAQRYDLITMIEVIEHLTDLRGVLRRVRELLKPGGMLFVTTPNRKSLRARVEKGFWREARKKYHLFLFDRASLDFHLRLSGFGAVKTMTFSPIPRPGIKFWLGGRAMQALCIPGSVCVIATK